MKHKQLVRYALPLLAALMLPVLAWAQTATAPATAAPVTRAQQIIVIGGLIVAVIQGVKKLFPGIAGLVAVMLNILLSLGGTYAVADPGTVFTLPFIIQAVLTAVGAAGVHDALRRTQTPSN